MGKKPPMEKNMINITIILVGLLLLSMPCAAMQEKMLSEPKTNGYMPKNIDASIQTLSEHAGYVTGVCFTKNGHFLISASSDTTIKLWDIRSKRCIRTYQGHLDRISHLSINQDDTLMATCSHDRTVKIWEISSGKCKYTLDEFGNRCATFSPDGKNFAIGTNDKMVTLWNANTGERRGSLLHTDAVCAVTYSPDGNVLAAALEDGTAKLWKMPHRVEQGLLKGHQGPVTCINFSPDGKLLVTGSADRTIKIWQRETAQCLYTLAGNLARIEDVTFTPCGKQVISCSGDGHIKVWDLHTQVCIADLIGHHTEINSVSVSPQGITASGAIDNTIKLWKIPPQNNSHLQ